MRLKLLCAILLIFSLVSCNFSGLENESPEPTSSLFSSDSNASETSRHYEKEGGFSYVIPEGWELTDIHGLKYQGLIDSKSTNIFVSNIAIAVDQHSGNLADYVDSAIETTETLLPTTNIIRISKHVNKQGLTYYSVDLINKIQNIEIMQVLFFFDLGDTN